MFSPAPAKACGGDCAYTLGDPLVGYPKDITGLPRGTLSNFELGGFHASKYCYPPFQLLKWLTATEAYVAQQKYPFNPINPKECIDKLMNDCLKDFVPFILSKLNIKLESQLRGAIFLSVRISKGFLL